jgi:hypothetical protein
MCDKKQAYKTAENFHIKMGYKMPFFSDPFQNNSISEKVFKDMLKEKIIFLKRRMKLKN